MHATAGSGQTRRGSESAAVWDDRTASASWQPPAELPAVFFCGSTLSEEEAAAMQAYHGAAFGQLQLRLRRKAQKMARRERRRQELAQRQRRRQERAEQPQQERQQSCKLGQHKAGQEQKRRPPWLRSIRRSAGAKQLAKQRKARAEAAKAKAERVRTRWGWK